MMPHRDSQGGALTSIGESISSGTAGTAGPTFRKNLMPRVFIGEKLESAGLEMLRQAGFELDEREKLQGDALKEALRAADGAIVRSKPILTAAEFEEPGKLRAVVRAGVGVDTIDVAAATRKGIIVMNTPGGNTVST